MTKSMALRDSWTEAVRSSIDIAAVVGRYVPLEKASGGTMRGKCPFHQEKTGSFHVNKAKGFFHCFGCGAAGDVFKFIERQEQLGFREAVAFVNDGTWLTRGSARPALHLPNDLAEWPEQDRDQWLADALWHLATGEPDTAPKFYVQAVKLALLHVKRT